MIVHQILNVFERFALIEEYETDKTKKETEYLRFINESLPDYLKLLENFLKERKTVYLVKDSVTWADITLAALLDNLGQRKDSILSPFKLVKEIDRKVNNFPQIVQWKYTRAKYEKN